jgi:hypothetical protein
VEAEVQDHLKESLQKLSGCCKETKVLQTEGYLIHLKQTKGKEFGFIIAEETGSNKYGAAGNRARNLKSSSMGRARNLKSSSMGRPRILQSSSMGTRYFTKITN